MKWYPQIIEWNPRLRTYWYRITLHMYLLWNIFLYFLTRSTDPDLERGREYSRTRIYRTRLCRIKFLVRIVHNTSSLVCIGFWIYRIDFAIRRNPIYLSTTVSLSSSGKGAYPTSRWRIFVIIFVIWTGMTALPKNCRRRGRLHTPHQHVLHYLHRFALFNYIIRNDFFITLFSWKTSESPSILLEEDLFCPFVSLIQSVCFSRSSHSPLPLFPNQRRC